MENKPDIWAFIVVLFIVGYGLYKCIRILRMNETELNKYLDAKEKRTPFGIPKYYRKRKIVRGFFIIGATSLIVYFIAFMLKFIGWVE